MPLDKKNQASIFGPSLDFEASRVVMTAKSERRAWTIASAASVLTGLSWVSLIMIMPLKTVEPYLVTVDKNSGQTQLLTVLGQDPIPFSMQSVLDKYWISNYVRWREVYDWYTLQRDYDLTALFSSPNVRKEYTRIFEGDNALDTKWGKRVKASVNILSIVNDEIQKIATVRFEKRIKSVEDKGKGEVSTWVATLSYQYENREHTEGERLKNPLGFTVMAYRVDGEWVQ